jgi:hypothetical protein
MHNLKQSNAFYFLYQVKSNGSEKYNNNNKNRRESKSAYVSET